jgi:hypothetical protein
MVKLHHGESFTKEEQGHGEASPLYIISICLLPLCLSLSGTSITHLLMICRLLLFNNSLFNNSKLNALKFMIKS